MARTRRQAKAAAAAGATETDHNGISMKEIPLAKPDFSKPTQPTLLDLIDQKRPRNPDGTPIGVTSRAAADDEEELEMPQLAVAFLFAVPLTMVLAAFDILVQRQYMQDLELRLVFFRCLKAFPVIWGIQYVFHPRRAWLSVKLFLLVIGVTAGCWLVANVNTKGYYAVMKRAPPLATLYIWAAVEMDVWLVVLSCAIVAGYTWWYGFSIL